MPEADGFVNSLSLFIRSPCFFHIKTPHQKARCFVVRSARLESAPFGFGQACDPQLLVRLALATQPARRKLMLLARTTE